MNIREVNTSLYKIEGVLSQPEFQQLYDEFCLDYNHVRVKKNANDSSTQLPRLGLRKPFTSGAGYSFNGNDMLGDNLALINLGSKVKLISQKILKRNLSLNRINTNIQYPGIESTFHQDGAEGTWTFIIFANAHWSTEWGGEFVYSGEDEYFYVPVIPNNVWLYADHRDHRGAAPNSLANTYRQTIAFSMNEMYK